MSAWSYQSQLLCREKSLASSASDTPSFFSFSGVLLLILIWPTLAIVLSNAARAEPPASDAQIDFERDVKPIFAKYCTECHGATNQTSDLRLDLRHTILMGGTSGAIVSPGRSSESRLIDIVSGTDPEYSMPPEGDSVPPEAIDILRRWIDQGAIGPDDKSLAEKPIPWSFDPVVRPNTPHGELAIDLLLEESLTKNNLAFSPEETKPQFIRRLYLIALGVPPSIDEVQQFVHDSDPLAVEHLVDRVLADPRYGERMARHWFDVVRFAESHGFETNRVRYNAWPYRDYVIQAFNQDLPYNQFVYDQIAGDTSGSDFATGFLVAGTYDLVKSPDINLTLMQRQDELTDLVNTIGTSFLGLTIGCARCHDHKFDPISHKDFYALQALVAGVQFADRNVPKPLGASQQTELAQWKDQYSEVSKKITELLEIGRKRNTTKQLRPAVTHDRNEEIFDPILTKAVRFRILASGNAEPCIDEWEVFNEQGLNIALASHGSVAKVSSTLPGYAIHKEEHINDGRSGNEFSWISHEVNGGLVEIRFSIPHTISRMTWGRDSAGRFRDRVITDYVIEAQTDENTWTPISSSRDRAALSTSEPGLESLTDEERNQYRLLDQKRGRLRQQIDGHTKGEAYWLGSFSQPSTTHRLHRGDPAQKREPIVPGSISKLDGFQLTDDSSESERRKQLAQWIIDPRNPLTARVMANRLWHYTFGTGLVDTPSDFGINGGRPSHPELLDFLATELVNHDWSLKSLHRMMFLSKAFRQSSKPNELGLRIDAQSRLLWRFPPRRLEAEAIRDSLLAVTGQLDNKMNGPGFFLQRVEQDNVYRYFPKEEFQPEDFRRMVYLTRVRQEQDSVFGAFDCPSGDQVVPRRGQSTTPLQSLNLFNSPFMLQRADALVARLERETNGRGGSMESKVSLAFELLFNRQPDEWELQNSLQFIQREGLESFCRAMCNANEFLYVF
ncbi:MAG: PSD1 and planctomycete cytochrome C domain-containing protein [Pirellula sp.]|nr:PSD1 and planctomycete cytochrome C domain-containing protein [Pirellula sp.]